MQHRTTPMRYHLAKGKAISPSRSIMLDFEKIIAGVAGQRETFEELSCQILRRLRPAPGAEFRRIHGAGGDGGVEAVWVLADGSEHGVQAKYYTKAASIDWAAVDKSVTTALATHPKLTKMYIAIACSLTGQTRRRTKTGDPTETAWDRWKTHKAKWEIEAAGLGRSIVFEPWSAADLEDLLARPPMTGLIDYWFGEIELSPAWLKAQADRTITALEERFHPEDHVDVSVREVFDGLLRTEGFRTALLTARARVLAEADIRCIPKNFSTIATATLAELTLAVAVFRTETAALETADWSPWPFAAWIERCKTLAQITLDAGELAREYRDAKRGATKGRNGQLNQAKDHDADGNYVVVALSNLRSAVGTFHSLLIERTVEVAEKRFVYLDGRAGSGKSHLIASEVRRILEAGIPTLFLIGTDFTQHGIIEQQILGRLGVPGAKFESLLGALDAKAEAESNRALIAIDAINEGAGALLWRPALQALAKRILAFPRLTFCVSCRREYTPQLLTDATRRMTAVIDVRGFETEEEIERAARVYMDRRGIVRPGTPWLTPEFSNPLFLRTTCLALEREKRTEFPRGMSGTSEVLAFFLDSTARYLGAGYDGSKMLIMPTRQALLDLAADMAAQRCDYVAFGAAHTILENAFRGFELPPGKTWVEILRFRGLLRADPNPGLDPADPFEALPDVIRFSFQRFQDHLIVLALLRDAIKPTCLFDPGAPLAFLLDSHGVRWQWRGVFYALWVHLADRDNVELVDYLPGGADAWWGRWEIQDAFIESVRWRSTSVFTDRTRALLNALHCDIQDIIRLLIELSVVTDHPWNAAFLHRRLLARPLAERDAFWTLAINHAYDDSSHSAVRLIDWASNTGVAAADNRVLELAATTLGWFCTATSGELRDRATKALTWIFAERPAIVDDVFAGFATCDDLYVVERLTAALYGAALRSTDPEPLRAFGRVAWSRIFADGTPPLSMLARDYARGVIELAAAARVLDVGVVLARCRPPYGATAPTLTTSARKVDARAARLGAESITGSCYKGLADFGRYTIESRVERFANAPLDGPRPETAKEAWKRFKQDFAERPNIVFAVEQVRQAYRDRTIAFDVNTFRALASKEDSQRIAKAEKALFSMLTPEENERYRNEVAPWANGLGQGWWTVPGQRGKGKPIDALKAKIWIANRAMSLGWTTKLFPHDRSWGEDRLRGSRIERIGKKYQRIALGELLARLADTYWLAPDYGAAAIRYDSPIQVEFVRDIEPSILPIDLAVLLPTGVPQVTLLRSADVPADERTNWVHEPGLAEKALSFATGSDLGSEDWLALYRYASCDIDLVGEDRTREVPWQQTEFYFASMLLLPDADRDRFLTETQAQADDFHEWLPRRNVDGPFLRELGRRNTWPDNPWSVLRPRGLSSRKYRAIGGSMSYQWESHLDGSMPNGAQYDLPSPWIVTQLGLRFAPGQLRLLVDAHGTPTAFVGAEAHSSFAFIRRDAMMRLAASSKLTPILTVVGERTAFTQPGVSGSARRVRYNGTLWLDKGTPRMKSWSTFD
ncbi:hypothetical protein NFI95_06160 [Acetobacteraceae bacterium KSS8]|uniref:ATP-binding protein n=1 Tax=Endosaccharibacter trunci TaxID=2812733 RepID=A0ABT1W868_9PROT|nr:hypothetical protein [Acetobacteraceae bacterium KSS8]